MTREEIEEKMHEAAEEIKPLVTTLVEALCEAHQKGYLAGVELGVNIGHPHWIPVEERLPGPHFADTSSDWVLVCTTKGGIFIDSYNHKHNEWCNNRTSVTHWMPLPQPPRKEE